MKSSQGKQSTALPWYLKSSAKNRKSNFHTSGLGWRHLTDTSLAARHVRGRPVQLSPPGHKIDVRLLWAEPVCPACSCPSPRR
jgi:hypothetical protein